MGTGSVVAGRTRPGGYAKPGSGGGPSKEIAELLFISVKTVQRHRANLLSKFGLRDRLELTRYAIRAGLVEP